MSFGKLLTLNEECNDKLDHHQFEELQYSNKSKITLHINRCNQDIKKGSELEIFKEGVHCKSLGPMSNDGTVSVKFTNKTATPGNSTIDCKNVLNILNCTCCKKIPDNYERCAVKYCPRRVCKPTNSDLFACLMRGFKIVDDTSMEKRFIICNECYLELFSSNDTYEIFPFHDYMNQLGDNPSKNSHFGIQKTVEVAKRKRKRESTGQNSKQAKKSKRDSKYGSWKVAQLKVECRQNGLHQSGRKEVLIERLERFDRQQAKHYVTNVPDDKPYADYNGPTINETIQVHDHISFTYCDRAAHSEVYEVTAPVIQVKAGKDGTGLHGSVIVNLRGSPYVIGDLTQIRRVKFWNRKMEVLMKVPPVEGREGYLEDFKRLISGGDENVTSLLSNKGNWFCSTLKKGGEEALKTAYGSTSATSPAEVQGKDTAAMDEK